MKKLLMMFLTLTLFAVCFAASAAAQEITRGETAKLIRQMISPEVKIPATLAYDKKFQFSDLSMEHSAYNEIMVLKTRLILIGDENNNVHPDENITVKDAVVMLVRILGYEPMALSQGGYPDGYMIVASQLGILKGVNQEINQNATYDTVNKMYETALDIPKAVATGYDAQTGKTQYKSDPEKTIRKEMENFSK